ncbi:NAD(P)-dependent alcohol dehydrogenase [uncultured Streptomyces sp.]|uniref:NAD(P)-dependent alcohol dehydrogenase n=1 Tax=uncultured Streptomyces sp. TaxID=174707 RepID=UPI0026153AB4|nr:NAD(P)-dependent alcohol dehydrogenase [uncultured Streptomyces sp.]
MRIRAALSETADGPFTVRDLDLDPPRADEILVRITAAGICHTDLSMRRTWPPTRFPMVFGHEGAGVVEAVGADVTTVAPGDSVCLSYRSCGACEQCAAGHPAYCRDSRLNTSGGRADGSTALSLDGAPVHGDFFGQSSFATYALAHERNTVKVPSDLDPVIVAPLGCSVQTGAGTVLNVLEPEPGSTVTVFGAGGVGLTAVMAAVASGCRVVAVDPVPARRALAEELGAAATVDPTDGSDTAAAVRRSTAGGSPYAIDTTGRPRVITQAIESLRRQGQLALVGMGGKAEFDIMTVMAKGLRLRGVIEGDADPAVFVPRLVELYRAGRLPLNRLITRFPFAAIEDAAQSAASGKTIKPVLTFG